MISPALGRVLPRVCAVVISVCALSACASTNLAPIGTHSGMFVPESDERKLWEASREAEDKILPAKLTYSDPALDAYLTTLANRLAPASYREAGGPPLHVRVRKDPRLNAMALPDGLIIVHTSILARAENEAQVAGILGHEITHVINRHQLRELHAIQNRQTATAIVGFVALLGLAVAAADQSSRGNYEAAEGLVRAGSALVTVGLQLAYTAMVNGYARDLEREADEGGMRLMAAAGYRPQELGDFFHILLADSPDAGPIETFFYGNHPRTQERIATVEAMSAAFPVASPPPDTQAEFDRRLIAVRVANATMDAYWARRPTDARLRTPRPVPEPLPSPPPRTRPWEISTRCPDRPSGPARPTVRFADTSTSSRPPLTAAPSKRR